MELPAERRELATVAVAPPYQRRRRISLAQLEVHVQVGEVKQLEPAPNRVQGLHCSLSLPLPGFALRGSSLKLHGSLVSLWCRELLFKISHGRLCRPLCSSCNDRVLQLLRSCLVTFFVWLIEPPEAGRWRSRGDVQGPDETKKQNRPPGRPGGEGASLSRLPSSRKRQIAKMSVDIPRYP
jgi:hypothetical protein